MVESTGSSNERAGRRWNGSRNSRKRYDLPRSNRNSRSPSSGILQRSSILSTGGNHSSHAYRGPYLHGHSHSNRSRHPPSNPRILHLRHDSSRLRSHVRRRYRRSSFVAFGRSPLFTPNESPNGQG